MKTKSYRRLTDQIAIFTSCDPSWPRIGIAVENRNTEWFKTQAEALAYARGFDAAIGAHEFAALQNCPN